MTTKQPTPQGISALLRKAAFEKSVSSASRIKGWRNRSPGFMVARGTDGEVDVRHEDGNFRSSDTDRQRSAAKESRYAEVIEAAGYKVERGTSFWPLTVKALTEED